MPKFGVGIIKAKIYAEFESVEKIATDSCQKSYKKVTEKWRILLLLLCATKFFGL